MSMRVEQLLWTRSQGWQSVAGSGPVDKPQFVLYFGGSAVLKAGDIHQELAARYPGAHLLGCSTGGEIVKDEVLDDSVVAAAVHLDESRVRLAKCDVGPGEDSVAAGRNLAEELQAPDLKAVFVLSDGIHVNGSALVQGITEVVGENVPLTGGLAGDGDRFEVTFVGADEKPAAGRIGALGFYGDSLSVGHGSVGGWDVFGPERMITRSEGNVLYELDGKPALDLYKNYLGEDANNLPGSALLFPLKIRPAGEGTAAVVRTIVGIDEDARSMIFAGNVPEGYVAQLMIGNFENLIAGAEDAAQMALNGFRSEDSLAVMISCIGRKLLLGQRISAEVEAVRDVLTPEMPQIGFYSYGEISPHADSGMCELHNQTMTITVFSEA
ncbi:MAG: FIST N-terminal domain-containing protein [Alphaproteobacteria bacterium]|nr:FIST N-terminal domain-containing protein [Alphaproteobacteria bacterium]